MFENQEIKFPVDWNYRIICLKEDTSAIDAIVKVLREHNCDETPVCGRDSSNGKYQAYNVTVTFQDLPSMRELSTRLGSLPCVKFLL